MVERPKIDMANEDIIETDSSQHIQRLPAFMLREIQYWNETISEEPKKDESKRTKQTEDRKPKSGKHVDVGLIEAKTANKSTCVSIRAIPLIDDITKLLETNSELLRTITQVSSGITSKERRDLRATLTESTRKKIKSFYVELKKGFEDCGADWSDACDSIWAFGPRGMGPNLLLNRIQRYKRPSVWNGLIEGGLFRYTYFDKKM